MTTDLDSSDPRLLARIKENCWNPQISIQILHKWVAQKTHTSTNFIIPLMIIRMPPRARKAKLWHRTPPQPQITLSWATSQVSRPTTCCFLRLTKMWWCTVELAVHWLQPRPTTLVKRVTSENPFRKSTSKRLKKEMAHRFPTAMILWGEKLTALLNLHNWSKSRTTIKNLHLL